MAAMTECSWSTAAQTLASSRSSQSVAVKVEPPPRLLAPRSVVAYRYEISKEVVLHVCPHNAWRKGVLQTRRGRSCASYSGRAARHRGRQRLRESAESSRRSRPRQPSTNGRGCAPKRSAEEQEDS